MDLFGNLIKAAGDYFGTTTGQIVLIVIVLTTIIGIILNYAVPAFGRFLWHIPQRLKRGCQMFREWYYWKRFHPDCTFINTQPAVISEVRSTSPSELNNEPRYRITLPMNLHIHSNDVLNALFLDCSQGNMSLRMRSKIRGRSQYYRLYFSSTYTAYQITSSRDYISDFVLTCESYIKPKLEDIAHCYDVKIGIISFSEVRIRHRLTGKPFEVEVDWSKVNLGDKNGTRQA